MKFIVNLVRVLVGVLFIFSGLVKANDPLGLSYKMQEFFEVWGWHGLNQFTLAFSLSLSFSFSFSLSPMLTGSSSFVVPETLDNFIDA